MDENLKWVTDQKIKRTMENLEKNNMEAYFADSRKEVIDKLSEILKEGDTVSVGGSMSLFETGIIDFLRKGNYKFLDRYAENLKPEDIKDVFRKSFFADDYIVSTNALTEDGELYNIDGNGNRVAAMLYGPDKVIVIAGINKIVLNLDEAIDRVKYCAAPANVKRLNLDNPCTKLGYCVDCSSRGRICNEYTLIKRQNHKGRIKVIIVNQELGY
ncbi:lactate utilization protein [Clostridium sp. JNZ X4-2]